MTKNDIQLLYEYDRWANARVLRAASALSAEQFTRDLGGSFRSVRDTLVHILGGEWGWLTYWKEPSHSPAFLPDLRARLEALFNPDKFPNLAAVRQKWMEVESELAEFVNRLTGGVSGTNASFSYHAAQTGVPDATSGESFHLPSRPGRTDDAPARR